MKAEELVEQERRKIIEAASKLAEQCMDLDEFKAKWIAAAESDGVVEFSFHDGKCKVDFDPITEDSPADVIQQKIDELQATLDELESNEPEDSDSDEYSNWQDKCNDLMDRIDEMNDWLDEKEDSEAN